MLRLSGNEAWEGAGENQLSVIAHGCPPELRHA
jgi:hypothetical protein